MFLCLNILLIIWKAEFVIPMRLQISVSQCLSAFKTHPSYLNTCTSLMLLSRISHRHAGMLLLLATNYSLFLQLMIKHFFLLFFTTFRKSPCRFLCVSINTVPFAYFTLALWLLIIPLVNVSNFLRISTLYRLRSKVRKHIIFFGHFLFLYT